MLVPQLPDFPTMPESNNTVNLPWLVPSVNNPFQFFLTLLMLSNHTEVESSLTLHAEKYKTTLSFSSDMEMDIGLSRTLGAIGVKLDMSDLPSLEMELPVHAVFN